MQYYLTALMALVGLSCQVNPPATITLDCASSKLDSLIITDLITERVLGRLAVGEPGKPYALVLDSTTVAQISTPDGKTSLLTILYPQASKSLCLLPDSSIQSSSVADSLLNALPRSTNAFIAEQSGFVFSSPDPMELLVRFEEFRQERERVIEEEADKLRADEEAILRYQNDARIYSFLFYFGRIIESLPADDPFFDFAQRVPNNSRWAKSLPQNLLYKHEVNYLRSQGALRNIDDFLAYVGSQTSNRDLFAFLKAIYLRELVESPSYWAPHQELFSTEAWKAAMQAEQANPYVDLIQQASENYFSAQKGEMAFNFTASRKDGSNLRLADLRGKVVFIDNWASWCGPCIRQRPDVLALADKYRNDPRVEVLMISVDASSKDWMAFLTAQGQLDREDDVIIENGMRAEYGDRYNIKSIPKYMLIDPEGRIVDANLGEPSESVTKLIDEVLNAR